MKLNNTNTNFARNAADTLQLKVPNHTKYPNLKLHLKEKKSTREVEAQSLEAFKATLKGALTQQLATLSTARGMELDL